MEKYLHYNYIDFAQEHSFIKWVRKDNPEDVIFWENWVAQHPEKNEDIEKAVYLVEHLSYTNERVDQKTEDRVWLKINEAISGSKPKDSSSNTSNKNLSNRMIRLRWAAVAAMFLLFFSVIMNTDSVEVVQTKYASAKKITLPDGSLVNLNADSKISYDKSSWSTKRELELDGEAFFEVKKGSSFIVKTDNGDVTVLGTSFNVFSRGILFDVYCRTGKVEVTSDEQQTILTPNQAVILKEHRHIKKNKIFVEDSRSSWLTGTYNYRSTPIGEVVLELERQLNVKISLPQKHRHKLYSGSFNSSNINDALSEVFWPLNLKYELQNNEVSVSE